MFVGKFVALNKLKNIITVSICIKFLIQYLLYFCNKTGLNNYIILFTVVDIVTEYIVITSIYPFSSLKLIALQQYAKKLNIEKKDIVFVDDKHSTLRKSEEEGFTSYHITSFMK